MTFDQAKALSLDERRLQIKILNRNLQLLYSTCEHKVKEIPGDYYAKDKWRSNTAHCEGCEMDLGWYCPKSSDHICHYDDAEDEYHDFCLYCEMPEERK